MNSNVFITGIDGFTGRYLEDYLLQKGYNVFGGSMSPKKPNHFFMDLTNKDSIYSAIKDLDLDFFIHLAAISFAMEEPEKIELINKSGVINLLEILDGKMVKRAIFASSASIYGNYDVAISENFSPNPPNAYATSKLFMENEIRKSSLNYIIARPFNYTGSGQNEMFLIPKIVKHFKNKERAISLGNLSSKREYNSVKDVVRIYEEFLDVDKVKQNETFNIGSGKAYSIEEILNILIEITGINIKVEIDQKFVRANDPKILYCDTSKLKSYGIMPCNTDIKSLLMSML